MSNKLSLRQRAALEVTRKMRKNLKQYHPLRQLFWECTLRCNIKCKHCGSDCKVSSAKKDMPAKDFLKVIDSITPHVNPHKINIIFTGGEPLMRMDLEDVGLELYNRGYPWGIVSNGLFLTRKRLDRLLAGGMHAATISLDGFEEDHNWMRGHPSSFAKASEAIRMLAKEPEIVWDVVTCVNQKNYAYLEEFKSYLYDLGVREWRLFTIFPVGRAAQHPELQLNDDDFTGLMEFIRDARKDKRMKIDFACEGFLGGFEGLVRDNFFHCGAGISVASVLADGSISACPSIRGNFNQGNIYEDDFMEVWNNRYEKFRNREWMKKDDCGDCQLFRYCEGNGMHLRDEEGKLLVCHYKRIV